MYINRANPKVISGRTSYSQARLAFHFLPQIILEFCTAHRFGPPLAFLQGSPCPWQARLASGLSRHFFKRAINARFHYTFVLEALK